MLHHLRKRLQHTPLLLRQLTALPIKKDKRGASKKRIRQYRARWLGWVTWQWEWPPAPLTRQCASL